VIDELSRAIEGLGINLPSIDLVKTTGEEEFNAEYTRERAILFPQRLTGLATTQPRSAFFLLAHELYHVLSRDDSEIKELAELGPLEALDRVAIRTAELIYTNRFGQELGVNRVVSMPVMTIRSFPYTVASSMVCSMRQHGRGSARTIFIQRISFVMWRRTR